MSSARVTWSSSTPHFLRFRDGKAVEHWSVRDDMTLMRQLGVVPNAGSPSPRAEVPDRPNVPGAHLVADLSSGEGKRPPDAPDRRPHGRHRSKPPRLGRRFPAWPWNEENGPPREERPLSVNLVLARSVRLAR
jgi:hypothetical protein